MDFAQLDLTHPDQPFSIQWGEPYFNPGAGHAEAELVFLKQNQLPQRWIEQPRAYFTIGETGFGTGLNFLVTWAAFRQQSQTQRLHFISTEHYPIHPDQLAIIAASWSEAYPEVDELLAAYRSLIPGWNRLSFQDAELTLWIGPDAAGLQDLNTSVDAWFLNGFSPQRQPQLWPPELFQAVAQHSHSTTTLATYTLDSKVRMGLTAAGFHCTTRSGLDSEQHCLAGRFTGMMGPQRSSQGWPRPITKTPTNIAIIGAGLAAAELAQCAQRRGLTVSVFGPTQTTLGNIQGAVYARPGLEADPNTQWYAHALSYRLRLWYQRGQHWPGQQSGLIQLLSPERWQKIQRNFDQHPFAQLCTPIAQDLASERAGVAVPQPALWFAEGGWLSLQSYIEQQLSNVNRVPTQITALSRRDQDWQLQDTAGQRYRFEHVIIATGAQAAQWPLTQHLPIQPVRGQITAIRGAQGPTCVICGQRYVTPVGTDGYWHLGSTFQPNQSSLEPRLADRMDNAQALSELAVSLIPAFQSSPLSDAVGIRAASPDRLPMGGAMVNQAIAQAVPWLWHQLQYHPGLWVMTGLGSKGLVSAPLLAEYVMCQITGEPLPFGHTIERRIQADRFWRKANDKP